MDTTLLTLFQELLAAYDSGISTTDGAPFRTKVLDPFLRRIGASPLDVDIEDFLVARLQEEFPDMDVSRYAGIRDLAIRAFTVMLEPFRREIRAARKTQNWQDPEALTHDEMNALLANFFTALEDGGKSAGAVRVYFSAPQTLVVTTLTQCGTGSGLKYFPTTTQSTSSTTMSFQQEDGLYYAEISVEAEAAGTAYNVAAGDINSIAGVQGVVKVSNPYALTTGLAAETNTEGKARAEDSITVRNLTTKRGIKFVISSEFDFATTIEVIGYRDAEMDRDVVTGPVNISSVADSYLVGQGDPDLDTGNSIHIGGKTDVYVYQETLVEDTLDIENLTDVGRRVLAGTTGYTATDSSGTVTTFWDDHGNFDKNGVAAGDYLRLGVETGVIEADLRKILSVTSTSMDLDGTLTSALFEQTYEIVRFDTAGLLFIPLYDLVAESGGTAVVDDDGNPVQPIPGDAAKGELESGSTPVAKVENIARNNVVLPLVWVKTVEFLEPLSLQPTGTLIPMADILRLSNTDAFSGGTSSSTASGTIRLFFRDAVNLYFPTDTRFVRGSRRFRVNFQTGDGQITGGQLQLVGDYTTTISRGYRILFGGGVYMISAAPTYNGTRTLLTVREDLAADGAVGTFRAYVGVLQSDMDQDADSGLYFTDITAVSTTNGTDGNVAAGDFTSTGVWVEGWTLRSTNAVHSLSTRDLPYLSFTRWVDDTTDLEEESTAQAVRVTYMSAPSLVDVQAFVDADDNRIVAEDILVRHFLPALVRGSFTTDTSFDVDVGKAALVTYIDELEPKENLEVSDLAGALRDEGATYVKMPITLSVLKQSMSRSWTASIVQDRVAFSRISHFIVDEDFLTVAVES